MNTNNNIQQEIQLVNTGPGAFVVTDPDALTKIYIDRDTDEIVVRNGREIARFGRSEENLVKAKWAAIEHDQPAAFAVAQAMLAQGRDEGRLIKACRLLARGLVTRFRRDAGFVEAIVTASAGHRSPVTGQPFYHVHNNLVWSCTCHDHQFNGHGHRCKHTLAVEIAAKLATPLDPVAVAQATEREAQERTERASGHYNANLTDEQRAAKLAEAQAARERARQRLARMEATPNGQYNGFGGPKRDEYAEVAKFDPQLAEQMERRAKAYEAALRPDPINRRLPNRNFNIERR